MVSFDKTVVALLLLLVPTEARPWSLQRKAQIANKGCEQLFKQQTTWSTKRSNKAFCSKKNPAAMGSMVHCLKASPQKKAIPGFIEMCKDQNNITLTLEDIDKAYDNATDYLVYNPKKTIEGWNKSEAATVPIGFSQKQYKLAYTSAVGRYYNTNYAFWFGIAMLSYWFGVLFIAGICNLFYFLFPNQIKKMNSAAINVFRKYITMPACFREQHVYERPFIFKWMTWLVPTRLEALLVLGYLAITIAGNSAYMQHVEDSVIEPNKVKDLAKLCADRSGITVMWIIPQLVLFAGRNNFMQWISGWSYARQIYIHKWCSRVATILVLVHTVAYTIVGGGFHGKKYLQWYTRDWMIWGTVALAAMMILCFHSIYFLRQRCYEWFLITHILLAVFAIIGGWIHCEDQGYGEWYYAAAAIWVFDRLVRIIRLVAFGTRKAEVQLMANETLRVTCTRPKWWKAEPGAHAFIHFLRPTCFFQSHPFTLVEDATTEDGEGTLTMYMKVKGGVTSMLYKSLDQSPGRRATIPVAIEGPYGSRIPLDRFNTTVFLTGGHGIPGLYSQARALAEQGTGTHVKFYWIIRHYQSVEWFYPELQKFNALNVDTVIYVTQPEDEITPITSGSESSGSMTDEKKSDTEYCVDNIGALKSRLQRIEFREGRPSVEELVSTEIAEASGSIAFTTCGAGPMVDATRKSIADNLMTAGKRVDLFEQAQIW